MILLQLATLAHRMTPHYHRSNRKYDKKEWTDIFPILCHKQAPIFDATKHFPWDDNDDTMVMMAVDSVYREVLGLMITVSVGNFGLADSQPLKRAKWTPH